VLINAEEVVAIFIRSTRFNQEAKRFAEESNVHINLIDGEDFISLWSEFYHKMNDDDKYSLPLHPIHFLGSNE
jgi:restriction system protein